MIQWPTDLVFEPTRLIFIPLLDIVQTNILTKFYKDSIVNEASIMYTRFFFIRFHLPCDLVCKSSWPSFKHGLDFIRINILTKFYENWVKLVPSSEYTSDSWRTSACPDGRMYDDDGHDGYPKDSPWALRAQKIIDFSVIFLFGRTCFFPLMIVTWTTLDMILF